MREKLLVILLAVAVSANVATFDQQVDKTLRGGAVSTTAHTQWWLYRYRDVTLMRKAPMCWCPFKAYLAVQKNVTVTCENNKNVLKINADLIGLLEDEAKANKKFAKSFKVKGSRKQKVRMIYNYCKDTTYVAHVKYASNVFNDRKGDCAGIASAFYVLCKAKKIPVRYVIGWDGKYCHAWNRVKINKKWYWIDATSGKWLKRKQYSGRTIMSIW